jgi:hypothetical protein
MKKYILQFTTLFILFTALLSGCTKDNTTDEVSLAYQMMGDKIWYLQYLQTTTNGMTTTKTFLGQPTYSIQISIDKSTKDSDGLTGTYSVFKVGTQLLVNINAKLPSGLTDIYNYNVNSLGSNNMVLSTTNGNVTTKYYYSTIK